MKIRSLLLGSAAAVGVSSGAFAADLGVLTSLDVCDALGISGLTISSDTNCLQISGSVSYEFKWGDFKPDVGIVPVEYGNAFRNHPGANDQLDWETKVVAWIKFVGTADSDFGPAKAVIKIQEKQHVVGSGDGFGGGPPWGTVNFGGSDTANNDGYYFDEAYVSVGDTTVLMAGKKGTIMNFGDDVPLNFLGLFNSDAVDKGVKWTKDYIRDGGHVIQVVSDLGNGLSIGAGLEAINHANTTQAGTLVGVIAYAGDGISAHATFAAGGVLDGVIEAWGFHAGVSGTFDMFKFVGAVAGDNTGYWNALGSAAATFDMFTIAVAGEAVSDMATGGIDYGAGASISAGVTDGITINLGSRWYYDDNTNTIGYQAAAQLVAAVTETITITGEVGLYGGDWTNVYYGAAEAGWAPGGGFTSSLKGEVYSNGAYRATFKAAKTFE